VTVSRPVRGLRVPEMNGPQRYHRPKTLPPKTDSDGAESAGTGRPLTVRKTHAVLSGNDTPMTRTSVKVRLPTPGLVTVSWVPCTAYCTVPETIGRSDGSTIGGALSSTAAAAGGGHEGVDV